MGQVKLKRGVSGFWAWAYRAKLARPPMPFWRVVVEARIKVRQRRWPAAADCAVAAVFVWARTIEEAEAHAVLALEREGLAALTADARKCAPAAAPRRQAGAVARSEFGFLARLPGETRANDAASRGARA
jgi:hypothetical protein